MTQTMTPPASTGQQPNQDQPKYTITDDDKKRIKAIQEAWKAYDGDFPKPLIPMPDQADDNVRVNRCEQIVNTGGDFLFGNELPISAGEDAPQEVQDFIDDVWGNKETRLPLLQKLHQNGALGRNAFLRIVPGDPGEFTIMPIDPSTVYIQTAPGNCEAVTMFCIQYACIEPDPRTARPSQMYYREEITRIDPDGNSAKGLPDDDDTWSIQHWTQRSQLNMEPKNTGWTPAGEPYTWPYNFAPMFMCQNLPRANDAWGHPDITDDLIDENKSLNLVLSNIQRVGRIYGNPHVWGRNLADQDIGSSPGHVTLLGPDGEMGAIQFSSDIPSSLQFASNLRSDMDEQSRVPAVATGRVENIPHGNISGVAIELMFMPLLKKTSTKRCTYGKLIIDVTKALLTLNRMSPDIEITLQWNSPLPNDALQQVQAAVLKKQAGVSEQTTLEELGYDYDEEQARSQAEAQQAMLNFSRGQGFPPTDMPPTVPPPISGSGQPGQPTPPGQGAQQQSPFLGR